MKHRKSRNHSDHRKKPNQPASPHSGVAPSGADASGGEVPVRLGALRPSREFVLATDAIVYLASHAEAAIGQPALARAVGASDADEAWGAALEHLVSRSLLSRQEENAVSLARSAEDITLADIAEAVGEDLRSEANGSENGGEEAFRFLLGRIWSELVEGFRAVPVSSLTR